MDFTADNDTTALTKKILNKAREYGADLAGFAAVSEMKLAPSALLSEYLAAADDPALVDFSPEDLPAGPVSWPEGAQTVLVIGIHHPADRPEMDWWFGTADPPGNRELSKVVRHLCSWISKQCQIGVFHLPYHIEKGGIYLKDAAVLSGIGCIGKNNMLLTPGFGPRIRLRALTLTVDLPSTGKIEFDPCADCKQWCRKACPRQALSERIRYPTISPPDLPGRDGCYDRQLCNIQMKIDKEDAQEQIIEGFQKPVKLIKYCRRCELSCPVGRSKSV